MTISVEMLLMYRINHFYILLLNIKSSFDFKKTCPNFFVFSPFFFHFSLIFCKLCLANSLILSVLKPSWLGGLYTCLLIGGAKYESWQEQNFFFSLHYSIFCKFFDLFQKTWHQHTGRFHKKYIQFHSIFFIFISHEPLNSLVHVLLNPLLELET